MTRRLTIVGCGYTGIRLAQEGTERGWNVTGTTRDDERLRRLESVGATGIDWEVGQKFGPLGEALEASDAVVYSVPSLYDDYEPAGTGPARHVEPVAEVLERAVSGGGRFVYLSSTSVYGDNDGAWVDEETPTDPSSPNGKMRRDIEEYVLSQSGKLDTNVARLVGIYGPGRTMLKYVASGRYKLVDGGTKPTNRIHVDDIVRSIVAVLERAPEGSRLYNVSDGHPKTVAAVVDWLVDHQGIERPAEVSLETYREERGANAVARWENTYRVANDRLLEELDVDLEYPDVFAGYRDILE